MIPFGLIIVTFNLWPHTNLFNHDVGLVLPCFPCLLCDLVLVFSEIHDLADGWIGFGGDLDEVESDLFGHPQCSIDIYNPDLLSGGADESNFADENAIVNARFSADKYSFLGSGYLLLDSVDYHCYRETVKGNSAK